MFLDRWQSTRSSSTVHMLQCTLIGNEAQDGGAMWLKDASTARMSQCTLSGNAAQVHRCLFGTGKNTKVGMMLCLVCTEWWRHVLRFKHSPHDAVRSKWQQCPGALLKSVWNR